MMTPSEGPLFSRASGPRKPKPTTVHMIMEMAGNRSFTLTTGNGKRSRLRHLKKGDPQGFVLAPLLFNTYISDLPTTISKKYA